MLDLARRMIAGGIDLLEGARLMYGLAMSVDVSLEEPFITFTGIASQIDHLDSNTRSIYEARALERATSPQS